MGGGWLSQWAGVSCGTWMVFLSANWKHMSCWCGCCVVCFFLAAERCCCEVGFCCFDNQVALNFASRVCGRSIN